MHCKRELQLQLAPRRSQCLNWPMILFICSLCKSYLEANDEVVDLSRLDSSLIASGS